MVGKETFGRLVVVLVGTVVLAVAAVGLFVVYPTSMVELAGVLLAIVTVAVGIRVFGGIGRSLFPSYDVAEVAIEGPITRDGGGGPLPSSPRGVGADAVVGQIERADADGSVDALIVKINTPGGEIVPSDDIRRAVADFDGPVIAYATDLCASGGYWIASGCDELWAREVSLVGSIGVIGSRVVATELAEKVGLQYEGFTAGQYKDAGVPLKEMTDDERQYFQNLVDEWYEEFIERVSAGLDLEPDVIRETEARVYLGKTAAERDLVDAVGTREDVEDALADRLGRESVTVETFEPPRPLVSRVGAGASSIAYAFGAGVASVARERPFELRL